MTLLVAGLVLFFAIHAVPGIAPLRAALVAGMGERPYRGVFSLIVLASFALMVWGFSEAPFEPVYAPAPWGRHAAMIAMPASAVLFVAANMPTHIRAVLRHPMLLGLLVWALAHLAANGDLASVVLFGGFAAFAVLAPLSLAVRGKHPPTVKAPRLAMDAAAVVGGLIAVGLVMHFHGVFFGMPV